MAPCGQNYVTPTMIKKGQVTVGDRIEFEDAMLVSEAAEAVETAAAGPDITQEPMPVPSPGQADTVRRQQPAPRPVAPATLPLIFEEMTNYAQALNNNGGDTPDFIIPSHPLVPPEYDQTVDYDSVQYMNGFLRTQIGRSVMVQQLIGSGNTVDRYGFLVGVGNNYLLLQDITNGNIMLVDFYTIKYVYIYYSQPVYPAIRPQER